MPRVAVLIPTWDRAPLVGAAVESVRAQRFADWELLVIDDGSTDDTAAIVDRIADPRVRYLRRPHAGIGATLNAGLAATSAPLVGRLDSDDVWLPDFLARTVAALDAHPDDGVAYARGAAIDLAGRRLAETRGTPPRFPDSHLASLLCEDFTCNDAVLVRRAALEAAGGWDEALPYNEDWDLWIRVARHARFRFVDEVLACFRYHGGNLTRRHYLDAARARVRVLDKAFATPGLPPAVLARRPLCYALVHEDTALRLLAAGRWRESLAAARRAAAAGEQPVRTVLRFAVRAVRWRFGRGALARRLARSTR